jgi:DNA polymerase/3'-5' exonuclease PolX
MSGTEKQRWPWEVAHAVAQEILRSLDGFVARSQIAGSLRRKKARVGDVEILYIPKISLVKDPSSLFGELVEVSMTDATLQALEALGILAKRKNVKGAEMFGEKNKLMVHVKSGIPVDLFAATEENWFNYLVCRTGGAENNVAIASAAQRKGWKWNPYGAGFSREAHEGPYGPVAAAAHQVKSEEEVFKFVGLPYRPPMERA